MFQSQAQARPPPYSTAVPDSSETTDHIWDRAETTDVTAEPEETTDGCADDTEFSTSADPQFGMDRRVFFVGISGPSCAGKSILAGRLAAELRSPVNPVPLDGYFRRERMPRHPKYGQNWEVPEGIDFKALVEDLHVIERIFSSAEAVPESLVIKAHADRGGGDIIRRGAGRSHLSSHPVVVVVEGFMLFYDSAVSSMFDAHLWLQADCESCCSRRYSRDMPSIPATQYTEWYNGLVWSHFLKYQGQQLANADGALKLDGLRTPPAILEQAAAYCRARLDLP